MDARERYARRQRKIKQRKRAIEAAGLRGGTLYERHRKKITENDGYLAKHGTLLHYANGTNRPSQKTRDRNSYSGTTNWNKKDLAQIQEMEEDLKEYNAD